MHKHYVINGVVEFHPATSTLRELSNPDQVVVLNSPAGRCLLLLIDRAGTIVTQQEFMEKIWHNRGMLVSPSTYYQNISILRKGLKRVGFVNDLIITIPRIGLTLASDTQIQIKEEASAISADAGERADLEGAQFNAEPFIATSETESDAPLAALHCERATTAGFSPSRLLKLFVGLITTLAIIGCGALFWQHQPQKFHYFDDYRFVMSSGGCRFFLASDSGSSVEKAEALAYAEQFKENCATYSWIYITRYGTLPRASVIRCDKPMTEPNRCVSDYFIEDR